jgi:hypothetical protein
MCGIAGSRRLGGQPLGRAHPHGDRHPRRARRPAGLAGARRVGLDREHARDRRRIGAEAQAAAAADLDLRLDRGAPWQERLHALVRSLMDVLRAHPSGGFSPAEAVDITEQIVRVTTSIAAAGFDPSPSPEHEAGKREAFCGLPAERFPRLREAAEPMSRSSDHDASYALGAELLVAGIAAAAASRS